MPICPRCNATIHTGAQEQCPACGYNLNLVDRVFGKPDVTFPRVKDVAGVLTQQERESLMRYLANIERDIPPVALCVYLTNHGQSQDFRAHAHWILNHARIHTPSFGQREGRRAIEDAELRELPPGEKPDPGQDDAPEEGFLTRCWHRLGELVHNRFSKCPPPVRHEWMLILVLDVQLKMACFSWGYMLDPYINPDKINSCITSARLQFRERARVAALEKVMRKAVSQLASNARRINRDIAKGKRHLSPLLAGALGLSLFMATPVCMAEEEDDMVAIDDDATEETAVEDKTPATPAPTAAAPGNPAGYATAPNWSQDDYKRLMAGELTACYRTLLPGGKVYRAPAASTKAKSDESDVRVLGHYCQEYGKPSAAGLSDPQKLLSTMERKDVEHVLTTINTGSKFRLYVAVFKAGQEIPQELNATTLATDTAQPDEHAAMILYSIGDTPEVQIGYREITPTDEQRRAWLINTQTAAVQAGGGVNGLIASLHRLKAQISPVAQNFRPLAAKAGRKLPLIPLDFGNKGEAKEQSLRDKMRAWLTAKENQSTIIGGAVAVVVSLLAIFLFLRRRRVVRLLDTTPDVRLASPHGAGVSRYVRYLDGKEAAKDTPLY